MKNNPVKSVLEWVLIGSLILSAYFFVNYYNKSKQHREFNGALAKFQDNIQIMNALTADLIEYSKHNPAINPLLEAFGIPKSALSPTAPAPAPKPGK